MKHGILILTLAFVAGLLISSQVLATGQGQMKSETQTQQKSAALELNPDQTKEMQRLLNKQGYEIENITGVIDEETMAAIRIFQVTEGLTVTGMPNQETLRALAPGTGQQEYFGISPEFGEIYYW
jgi:peptidoglycan hydrolase-like protein with peptidoglycan-binding domain